jgi:hypothetical protein
MARAAAADRRAAAAPAPSPAPAPDDTDDNTDAGSERSGTPVKAGKHVMSRGSPVRAPCSPRRRPRRWFGRRPAACSESSNGPAWPAHRVDTPPFLYTL